MNSSYSILPPAKPVSTVKPKVGDVLVSTWGYEQTNADFYKVTKVMGAQLELVSLGENEKSTPGSGGMFGTSTPDLTRVGLPKRKKFKTTDKGYYVKINSFASAFLWDGEPVNVSHTH